MNREKLTEARLASVVIDSLRENGWTVYQEICPNAGRTLDILACQKGIFFAIETKLNVNQTLLQQASKWKRYAHYSYAVIPKKNRFDYFWSEIFSRFGVGLIEVRFDFDYKTKTDIPAFYPTHLPNWYDYLKPSPSPPYYNRSPDLSLWQKFLKPEYEDMVQAGTSGIAGRISPFKHTVLSMAQKAKENPGLDLKKLIEETNHHWSTPRSAFQCIVNYARKGIIKEFTLKKVDNVWLVFPNEE